MVSMNEGKKSDPDTEVAPEARANSDSITLNDNRKVPLPRVLMIEDDPYYCKFIRLVLNRRNVIKFEVIYVSTLAEAALYLARETVDVILLDLGLPDGKGITNLLKVKEFSHGIPVIILTASDDEETGLLAVALGAQDFLVKQNISNEALSRCLLYALERRKSDVSSLRFAAIRDFTATLAHDLQVPLIGNGNVLDALVSGQFGDLTVELMKVVSILRESNRNQLELIQRLLQVYRYEMNPSDFAVSRIFLSQTITRCVEDASSGARVKLATSLEPTPVRGDDDALYRLFANLLDNALKFSDGLVEIRVVVQEHKVLVEVHNFGPAIPEEVQRELFQKFWKGVPGKTYLSHTGLGLYLCHQIVTLHRGTITCRSTAQEGTTFRVWLPLDMP